MEKVGVEKCSLGNAAVHVADEPVYKSENLKKVCLPVKKAITYLNTNYNHELDLNVLADVAGISKYHFARLFKSEVKMTYRHYMRQLRFNEAKRLLISTNMSISQVCYSVGYFDLTTFGRIFKQNTSLTPSEYRKNSKTAI